MRRTRTGWLAGLLTAGLALVPTTGRGQTPEPNFEVPRAEPVFPLPLGHDRLENGGFYTFGEFLYLKQNVPLRPQIIARRGLIDFDGSITADLNGQLVLTPGLPPRIIPGAALPGNRLGSFTPVLFANDVGQGNYQPGFAIGAGWRFQDGFALEFEWRQLLESKYAAGASLVPLALQPGQLLQETFLFAPVYNFPNSFAGPPNKLALGTPFAAYGIWNGASIMQTEFVQRYTQADLTGRMPIFMTDCVRCYALAGPRFAWIWERFKWRTVSINFAGEAAADDSATYTNITSNRMYGSRFGVGTDYYLWNGFSLVFELNAAPMLNFVKERVRYQRDDRAVAYKRSSTEFTFVPEVDATMKLFWYPIEGVQLRLGYSVMGFFNTRGSREPVSFNFGSLDPHFDSISRIFHGLDAGIAFIF